MFGRKSVAEVVSSSDDDDSDRSGDEGDFGREKRNASWCHRPQRLIRRVVWPPPTTSEPSFRNAYIDPRSAAGNIHYGNKMQLYSKTGFMVGVYPDGKVRGTRDDADEHTFLERLSGGLLPEHVKFRGMLTNLFVAMDKKGRLYAEPDPNSPATVFIESFHGNYNNFLSRPYAHLGWYMGIKKSGKFKNGSKTRFRQKAVKFLPIRTRFQ